MQSPRYFETSDLKMSSYTLISPFSPRVHISLLSKNDRSKLNVSELVPYPEIPSYSLVQVASNLATLELELKIRKPGSYFSTYALLKSLELAGSLKRQNTAMWISPPPYKAAQRWTQMIHRIPLFALCLCSTTSLQLGFCC